jgi:PAS domain S-box-containing protein
VSTPPQRSGYLAMRELRESEERFRLLVEHVQEYAIFMLDQDGYVISWNSGAERIKGYRAAEIIGSHVSRFYSAEDCENGKPARALATARETGRWEDEGWRVRKDGTTFWANVVLTALRDRGELRGFAKITRDLTERRLREQAQRAAAVHEAANRVKDEFLATLSHELRTPLNVIMGQLTRLRTGKLTPDQAERAWDALERNTKAQLRVVEDLLDTSRILSGRLHLAMQEVMLGTLVRAVLEEMRPMFEAKGVHLFSQVAPAAIIGDPARLRQIVNNLLSNALKHTPEDGRVDVEMAATDTEAILKVHDTGGGIPSDFLPRVFDRFAQADPFVTRVQGGLGLGLAITKDLVAMHGGTIEARSPGIGKGATFTIKLPLAPATATDSEWSTPNLVEPEG